MKEARLIHAFKGISAGLLNVVDKFEDFCDFRHLDILALHSLHKFLDPCGEQFLYLLL